jgi:hypothetical protein
MPLDLSKNEAPKTPEDIAKSLKTQAKNIFNNMANSFIRGSKAFWQNPNATPQEIALALGPDAKELFELHYKLGQLVSSVDPLVIAEGISAVGKFELNEDGTVTILEN